MSELREADRPPAPETDVPASWAAADTGVPTEPKAAESFTEAKDDTTDGQMQEPVEPAITSPAESGESAELTEPSEPTESVSVGDPTEPDETPWEPGELVQPEGPTESGDFNEPKDPNGHGVPEASEKSGEQEQLKEHEEPEAPEGFEESGGPEEPEGFEEAGGPEEPEDPDVPGEVDASEGDEGADADPGEQAGDSDDENSPQSGETSELEAPVAHDAEGSTDGLPSHEENPESTGPEDDEQVTENLESDDVGELGDSGDKIQETVEQPPLENMYFETGHEVKGLTYGDPINESPVGKVPLFDGPPARDQIAQGRLGDCGVIASIGAVAGHRPEAIENAVRENPDGTYTVTLHDAAPGADGVFRATERRIELLVKPDLPIVESNPNAPAFAALRGSAWGAVLEKSMAGVDQAWEANRRENWEAAWQTNPKAGPPDSPTPAGYERLNQGSSQWDQAEILTQLTGEDSAVYPFPKGESAGAALESHLRQQLADNKPILAGTRPLDEDAGEKALPHNLIAGHAYEVVGAQDGLVHLRNPWNMAHPEPMKAEEFMENFSYQGWGFYATLT
ncbi:hypothetical protein [Streptomyces sp. NPDC002324]